MKAPLFCSLALLTATVHAADGDDTRQLASLPAAAESTLRAEMRANLLALNEILGLVSTGKFKEAGQIAEQELGVSAMGKHRSLPFEARPDRTCRRRCTVSAWTGIARRVNLPASPPAAIATRPSPRYRR
jgi:hypothetical protein